MAESAGREFELPQLPLGWSWNELPGLSPNSGGEHEVKIRATSNRPGKQYIEETIRFNILQDSPDAIVALFQAVCDKIVVRILEVQQRPVQRNIDILTDIYKKFEGGE